MLTFDENNIYAGENPIHTSLYVFNHFIWRQLYDFEVIVQGRWLVKLLMRCNAFF